MHIDSSAGDTEMIVASRTSKGLIRIRWLNDYEPYDANSTDEESGNGYVIGVFPEPLTLEEIAACVGDRLWPLVHWWHTECEYSADDVPRRVSVESGYYPELGSYIAWRLERWVQEAKAEDGSDAV